MFTGDNRHQSEDQCDGCNAGAECQQQKQAAMPPVEMMTLAQRFEGMRSDRPARIKQPVQNVHSPGNAGEQKDNPWFETNVSGSRDGESPYYRDSGGIEACKMPKRHKTAETPERLEAMHKIGGADYLRTDGRRSHSSDSRTADSKLAFVFADGAGMSQNRDTPNPAIT